MLALAEFEAAAVEFLDAHAKLRGEGPFEWGVGSDRVGLFDDRDEAEVRAAVDESKQWRGQVFDAGFGWITGPAAYGGRELPAAYEQRWLAVAQRYDTPSMVPFAISLGMIAPTLLAHGTAAVKDAYLRRLYRGAIIACQLFSEPGHGSDLAGVETRAVAVSGGWVLNGQKVWTSGAQHAAIGEVLCRTDREVPKHRGLTMFVIDMGAPGVEVRPLRQMTGGASFNEVFLSDVFVPDDHRLGGVNEGWGVALTTLMNERASIGGGGVGASAIGIERFVELARHLGAGDDPVVRQDIADLYARLRVARLTNARGAEGVKAGRPPGPEMSIAKLALCDNVRRMSQLVSRLLGPSLIADSGAWGTYAWSDFVLSVPGLRLAGGTDEVLRNVVAERVLGLPKDR